MDACKNGELRNYLLGTLLTIALFNQNSFHPRLWFETIALIPHSKIIVQVSPEFQRQSRLLLRYAFRINFTSTLSSSDQLAVLLGMLAPISRGISFKH